MYHNYQATTLVYTQLLSVVYAIFSLSIGIVFPIAEAVNDQWLNNLDNTIFLTFSLTLSSIFLVYMLFYNLRCNRKSKKSSFITFLRKTWSSFKKKVSVQNEDTVKKLDNEIPPIEIVIDPPKQPPKCQSHHNFMSMKTWEDSDSNNAYRQRCSQLSLHKSDLILDAREIQPAADLLMIPHRPQRRKSICTPIREISVEESVPMNGSLRKKSNAFDEKEEVDNNNNLQKDAKFYDDEDDEKDEFLDDEMADEEPLTWIDAESFGSVFTHHGSNLFLRLGALIFGLGNMVNYALEIQANLITNEECFKNMRFKWIYIWMFIFVFLQTFFLFKHSKIKVVKHQPLVWIGMVHLILTNINLWIHALAIEIVDQYHQQIQHSNSDLDGHSDSQCDSNLLHSASPYLSPFVLEYSMIAVGIISSFLYYGAVDSTSTTNKVNRNLIKVFSMTQDSYNRCASTTEEESKAENKNPNKNKGSRVRFLTNDEKKEDNVEKEMNLQEKNYMAEKNQPHGDFNSLQKSHAGLFAGMVLLCVTVVTCVIFLFSQLQHNRARAEIIYFCTDITAHSLLLITCISACVKTRSLAFAPKNISTDDFLLLFAAFGSFIYELTSVIAVLTALRSSSIPQNNQLTNPLFYSGNESNTTSVFKGSKLDPFHSTRDQLQLASSCVSIAQTAVQTLLIFISLRRYPATINQATEMPGRGTMAFLIVGNLSVWILRTILCKSLQLPVQMNFFGHVGCLLLIDIHLPLLLFFRFHSSVCFADVWSSAYRLLTRFPDHED